MDRYKKFQIIASFCVAVFIVSFSFCLLCMDRKTYVRCCEGKETYISENMSVFEAQINYEKLADDFTNFFKSDYQLSTYEISDENIDILNKMKNYYRTAWVMSVLSLTGAVYSFFRLYKRREYMPLIYGGVLAAFFTALISLAVVRSDKGIVAAVKNMILFEDYSVFSGADILLTIIPDDFARRLALLYILIVFVMVVFMVLLKGIIIYLGRPHKF